MASYAKLKSQFKPPDSVGVYTDFNYDILAVIAEKVTGKNIGILITDHNVRETLSVTDRAYIINEGRIFRDGTPEELGNDSEVRRVYLGEAFSLS